MQHTVSSPPSHAPAVRAGLLALAAVQLAIGLAMAIVPGTFFDAIADFGPRNDHDLRDFATYYLASGVALAVAAGRPSWRVPVLALVGLQYLLHALNHLLDVGDADPSWIGPFDLVTLAATALVIALLHRSAAAADEVAR